MAQAKTVKGSKFLIKIEDPATPGTFVHTCSINAERGFVLTAETNDVSVPDCDNPDLVSWVEREKRSLAGSISGAGVLNSPDIEFFFDYLKSEDPYNVKVVLDVPAIDGGRIFSGEFHCVKFEQTGTRGEKVTVSIDLQSNGEITIADNA